MPIESVDALLQPNTAYRLYAVSENIGENTVYRLLDFKTDAEPSSSDVILYNMPPAEYTFTMRQNEPALYLFCVLNAGTLITWILDITIVTQISNINGVAVPYRLNPPYNSLYVTTGINNSILTTALISKRQFEGITIQDGKKIVITGEHGGPPMLHDFTVIFQAVQ